MPNTKSQMVGSAVVADIFGVDPRRIQQLTKEGVLTATRQGHANRYDLFETVRQYIRYLSEKANGRAPPKQDLDAESRKLEAEADFKRSKADMAALQLKELEGTMHRSEDVQAVMTDLIYTIRSMLMALPGRLAVDVAAAVSAAQASDIIRSEVYEILDKLSGYKYDPEEYAKRVREREGWSGPSDDEDE